MEYSYRDLHVPAVNGTFTGPTSKGTVKSWRGLMAGTVFRLLEEELRISGMESELLLTGGYAGGLGVSHHLHCLVS